MAGEILLVDCCHNGSFVLDLNESASDSGGRVRFKGKFQEAEAVNKNKRMYPFAVLDENVKKLQEAIKHRGLIGELDHPTDSIIHFEKASHIITKLWWEGKSLMGEGEILNTPHGKILKSLLNDGVRTGISSRGVGTGRTDENGIMVIGESYKLITFDAVADPSTFAAFQSKVVSRKESVSPESTEYVETPNYVAKIESSSIHKNVSKDALIACLGGLIQQQTSNIKARLG
jgi:hypothetical protein